jgi:cytochrome c oxidase cbb3-type subunit II
MNRGALLFLGVFFALAGSWYGMVLKPQLQLGNLQQTNTVATAETYPAARPGLARQGLELYRANGCVYCHSQQVRPMATDLERWGKRRTVAEDYLFDTPVLLGSQRVGPDLTNIGVRPRSEEWHLLHFYDPRSVVPDSTMPPYRYLFTKRKVAGRPAPEALKLTGKFAPGPGWEIVPKPEARALIAYLLSLHSEATLFETPMPAPPTNAPPAFTNALVPAGTNMAANPSATNSPK